ncbi:hypothetical protein [Streptomyces sp. PpalLS-921]|uniref:hypothetical protein n=1 Tax=Streptomyces sp. PpalLS-921 TaxID=1839772 RepID=UPI00081E8ECA|nr:hypothetical protein [Streptomyces sp. PpalLS-921]SCD61410.1 hypothetical protein GA0115249_106329 [Streptomyces sp. PpalLS-921]
MVISLDHPREEIAAWLTANGIDPGDVPLGSQIDIGTDNDGAPVIRYTTLLRRDGHLYLNDDGTGPASEQRETPMHVAPPEGAQWRTDHQLTIRTQIETRRGSDGWAEHRKTGISLVACNCGFTTGWTPQADLPSLADLTRQHGGT